MSMQTPCKLESAVHTLASTINRGWLLWFGVVREGFILLIPFRTNILKCKWKWEAEAHILHVFLVAGLWDVAHFLQLTPSSVESARVWNPCPDQLETNRIWAEMGLTGAQGHAKPKGRGMVSSLSEPHTLSRQRLLTDLPGGSLEGTVVCWPFRRVSYLVRPVVYGDLPAGRQQRAVSRVCSSCLLLGARQPQSLPFLLSPSMRVHSWQFNVSIKIRKREEDLESKHKPNSQNTLYGYTVITLGHGYS